MYSQKEKMKAVKFYINLEENVLAVIRLLGYPSPNTLRQWYAEYHQTGTLHQTTQRKPKYTSTQIRDAVDYYASHGNHLQETVRALGYPNKNTLREWAKKANIHQPTNPQTCCQSASNLIRYDLEQKQAAVEAWLSGEPDYKVAIRYNVSKAAIYAWKKKLLGKETHVRMKKKDFLSHSNELPDNKEKLEAEIKTLKSQIYQLQMERDALEVAAKIAKKNQGINLTMLTNAQKAGAIDALKKKYRLQELLLLFKIAKSSYFYQHNVSLNPNKYIKLRNHIKQIFSENYECYGYRRMHAVFQKEGIQVSEKVIRRIMYEERLVIQYVKRKKYNSYLGEISPSVDNIIKRDFHADAPNKKWLTDLTEFALPLGKVYLSPVLDCFDGMAVNWTIGLSPNAALANTMIDGSIARLHHGEHPIIHSDRGSHYRWPGWIQKVENAGLIRSMSKKGCSPDNAACEGFFGRIKNEMFYQKSWRGISLQQFMTILDQYLHWYNEKRIKISLGAMSPVQYRQILGLSI